MGAQDIVGPMTGFFQMSLLFATGLTAGFVDSIAGGGGLITLPVLLGLGLQPQRALGTNKLQATFGSGSAAAHYVHARTVTLRESVGGFVWTLVGASAGALTVQQLDPGLLRKTIPLLLIVVTMYFVLKPQFGERATHPRLSRRSFELVMGLSLGFYDGFFGPGTGTFWALACVAGLGYSLTRATGYTKIMNFASNLSSLVLFLCGGQVDFSIGAVMGIGQLLGARMGARLVVSKGTRLIRPVFLSVVLALTVKLLYDAYLR